MILLPVAYDSKKQFVHKHVSAEIARQTTSKIFDYLKSERGPLNGLIYCKSKVRCDDLCLKLQNSGFKAGIYHKDHLGRHEVQQQWMDGEIDIVVCTLAFGMGIDKPDVRFVIHDSMPDSLE